MVDNCRPEGMKQAAKQIMFHEIGTFVVDDLNSIGIDQSEVVWTPLTT